MSLIIKYFYNIFMKVLHLEINQQVKIIQSLEQTKRKVFEENQELLHNYEEKDIQLLERTKKW